MNTNKLMSQIERLETRISLLPIGSITKKNIRGRTYFYHRFTQEGKRTEKYIAADELDSLRSQIEKRKSLEDKLKQLKSQLPKEKPVDTSAFATSIRLGSQLRAFSSAVRKYKKRTCFGALHDYIYGDVVDKVFILCGLRRTGKTTLIRQLLLEMDDLDLSRAAFIQVTPKNTLADMNHDLRVLESLGYKYIFLDEVTLMEDFIEGAALFSDVFATCGMKIVLSGTDSLGFLFSQDEQLYDRCILLHTTFISYQEFESVLGIHGIDEYIRFGGTMSLGGVHYNETSTFASKESTDEYVDSAIARNIQHSLMHYQYGGHFRGLKDLYDSDELTSAINRVVEDINHSFTIDVLTRDFKSHDLGISARNLRSDRKHPTDILDKVDIATITKRLCELLEIRNKSEQKVELSDAHAIQIKEYLDLLDFTHVIDVLHLPDVGTRLSRTVIAQPGLRYAQVQALVRSLLLDETFATLAFGEKEAVIDRILSEVRGRMLEDIVLLETHMAHPKQQVFVLQFPIGEFDMVVHDPAIGTCQIYEIKHSDKVVPSQYTHLVDEEKCAQTSHRFGSITGRFVLYRGASQVVEDIQYINVQEYLVGVRQRWKKI